MQQHTTCRHLRNSSVLNRSFRNSVASLTSREQEVLLTLVECTSNREIANTLGITERTVKAHLTSIMAKLGLQARTEATVVALRYHALLCPCSVPTSSYQGPMAISA